MSFIDSHPGVLVVDDDDGVRRFVAHVLAKAGYSVLEAPSGQEALRLLTLNNEPIRLLLTDVRMPEMDGIELAARVRNVREGIRVVYMTGFSDNIPDLESTILRKPFTMEVLKQGLEHSLAQ